MVPAVSIGISPVPTYSGYPSRHQSFQYGTLTPSGRLSHVVLVGLTLIIQVLQPRTCRNMCGLGCSAFARHYLRNHYYFLLLWVLRCFSSPRSLSLRNSLKDWVAPFGYLRINSHWPIPVAFRSLSRPSSPLRA